MISFDQARKAFNRHNINADHRQIADFLADLLPNPQSGFSCDGATVWGDNHSIDKVKNWNHEASTVPALRDTIKHERDGHATLMRSCRDQVDGLQSRAIRAEELGLRLLNELLNISAGNPASAGYSSHAAERLAHLNLEPREGFFHSEEAALADAREKFYAAAHHNRS